MLADRIAKALIGGNELRRRRIETPHGYAEFVEVKEGCLIDKVLSSRGKAAITLGRYVILREGRMNPKRIRHELVHVEQWAKYGALFFLIYPFRVAHFERPAEEAEKKQA